MISKYLLILFLGKLDNYAHFMTCLVISVLGGLFVNPLIAFIVSIIIAVAKEAGDYLLEKRWGWSDLVYGVLGAILGYVAHLF